MIPFGDIGIAINRCFGSIFFVTLQVAGIIVDLPIYPELEKLVLMEDVPKSIKFKDITFRILSPTKKNFDRLREEWTDWLNKKKLIQDVEL